MKPLFKSQILEVILPIESKKSNERYISLN